MTFDDNDALEIVKIWIKVSKFVVKNLVIIAFIYGILCGWVAYSFITDVQCSVNLKRGMDNRIFISLDAFPEWIANHTELKNETTQTVCTQVAYVKPNFTIISNFSE